MRHATKVHVWMREQAWGLRERKIRNYSQYPAKRITIKNWLLCLTLLLQLTRAARKSLTSEDVSAFWSKGEYKTHNKYGKSDVLQSLSIVSDDDGNIWSIFTANAGKSKVTIAPAQKNATTQKFVDFVCADLRPVIGMLLPLSSLAPLLLG